MHQYLELLNDVLTNGKEKKDRTGVGTYSVFGRQMRFDLQKGFPLVTTKKCHLRSIIHELLWFLKGDTNIKYLNDNGVTIWDEWALKEDIGIDYIPEPYKMVDYAIEHKLFTGTRGELLEILSTKKLDEGIEYLRSIGVPRSFKRITGHKGDLGPVYGAQWRSWKGCHGEIIDQISTVIKQLKEDPDSRRIIVSAWNVGELKDMALAPCHALFQFYTEEMCFDERVWEFGKLLSEDKELKTKFQLECYPIHSCEAYEEKATTLMDSVGFPKRKLSCQLYQRKQNCALQW